MTIESEIKNSSSLKFEIGSSLTLWANPIFEINPFLFKHTGLNPGGKIGMDLLDSKVTILDFKVTMLDSFFKL